ncbi:MAG: DUF4199 domain-containing protein [Paludibacteraceae bacterium]|nr:DUF4199 domain-containing protein [Paludibacteraceae bacterium]
MKQDTIKHAMYYGLLLGVVFVLNFFLSQATNIWLKFIQMLYTFSIPFVVFCFAKKCREDVCGGTMSYGQSFLYVVQLFFYASIISSAFKYVYFRFLNPDFLKKLFNQTMQLMEQMSVPITDEMIAVTKQMLTPMGMAMQYIWINVMVGIVVSIVLAFFIRKEKSVFEN